MSDNLFRQEVTATAGANSAVLFLPPRAQSVAVAVHPGAGGTAKAQFTFSAQDDVLADAAGANVRWIDWDEGSVSVATARGLTGLITGVRLVATTTAAIMEMVVGLDR